MKYLKQDAICIIPARSGSQRIKNKNIVNFFGSPIISYAIKAAINSNMFDKVIVSTDSKKIADISKKNKSIVNDLRNKKYSNNFATIKDVLRYEIKKNNLLTYKYLCCIYPCSGPLLSTKIIKKSFNTFFKNKADEFLIATKYDYPPERALKKIGQKFLRPVNKSYINTRTQDCSLLLRDTGSVYIFKMKNLIKNNKNNKTAYLEVPSNTFIDVDYPEDLKILKFLFKEKLKN